MQRRRVLITVAALILLVSVSAVLAWYVKVRASWYYIPGGTHFSGANLLVTCAANTPKYRGILSSRQTTHEPSLANVEVHAACVARTLFRQKLIADSDNVQFGVRNDTLTDLVDTHRYCGYQAYTEEEIVECKQAHLDAIDWLLSQGVDVNRGAVLQSTIISFDEQMFYFLLSRGADPAFRPEYGYFGPGVEKMIDVTPRSPIEALERHIERRTIDDDEAIAAWRRMLDRAKSKVTPDKVLQQTLDPAAG